MIWLAFLKSRIIGALTGIAAQAMVGAVVVALVVGGVWWLRHDARTDERALMNLEMANARADDSAKALARQRASEEIAAKRHAELELERDQATAVAAELHTKLSTRGRVIVYPKDIVKALNK